jgi:hypothetical protein
MNSDKDTLQSAYADALKGLYTTLLTAYANSAGDAEQQKEADQRFVVGVGLARSARDKAIALLP